jgi:exopolyphosphatase / guanosine-5'-triphosphate,3'-diphosphate pyrophosphatase
MRYAILDLGTNTFNLLIIETDTIKGRKVLLSRKEPVKLGEGGISKGIIIDKAFSRGIKAIENHMSYIKDYRAEQIHAYATSAIRSAANGLEFVRTVYQKFNIGIQVISGDKEAELIYHGVRQIVDMGDKKHLILDIGGGSNELIIADSKTIFWKKSFPLGMARLLERFRPSDPVTSDDIDALEGYFEKSLDSFFDKASEHKPKVLIGSSGSFDTIRALLTAMKKEEPVAKITDADLPVPGKEHNPHLLDGPGRPDPFSTEYTQPLYIISPEDFTKLYDRLIKSTAGERLNMEGMDPMRVEMIVIAAIFINFIVRKLNIGMMIQSDYSLKEGAVLEILDHQILSA